MSKKYSEFEQNLNPGSHLLNLDDETLEEGFKFCPVISS